MNLFSKASLAVLAAAATLSFGASSAQASGLIGSTVDIGFYVSGDYLDYFGYPPGVGANQSVLDPDGDGLREVAVTDGLTLDFNNLYFGHYMDVTFTETGLTITNLITAPFPDFNYVGLKIDLVSGLAIAGASFNAPASGIDYQGFTTVSSTPSEVDVNLAGVCGVMAASACHLDQPTAFISVAAVPEPASWALMIGGFGMVGATMRRRRQTAAAA